MAGGPEALMRFVVASLLAILLVGCAPRIHFNRTTDSWERSLPTLEDRVDIPYDTRNGIRGRV